MESFGQTIEKKDHHLLASLLACAAAVGLFALGMGDPFALSLLGLFIPIAFLYIRAVSPVWQTLLWLGVFFAAAWLLTDVRYAVVAVCVVAPVAFLGGYAVRRKFGFYYSVLITGASVLAALGILLLGVYLLFGRSLLDIYTANIQAQMEGMPGLTRMYYYMLAVMDDTGQLPAAIDFQAMLSTPMDVAVQGLMREIVPWMQVNLPQVCAICVSLFALLDYLIPRAILKKQGREVGKIPPFSTWQLPKGFGRWSIVLMVLAFVGVMAGWRNFELVYSITIGVFTVIYSVQGLALIDWLLKKKLDSTPVRVVILFFAFALGSAINLCMWLGLFEQLAKIRKRQAEQI